MDSWMGRSKRAAEADPPGGAGPRETTGPLGPTGEQKGNLGRSVDRATRLPSVFSGSTGKGPFSPASGDR